MFTLKEIIDQTQGGPVNAQHVSGFCGISTDSRRCSAGGLFIAVKGEKFDGHDFVAQALKGGAGAAIVCEDWFTRNRDVSSDINLPLIIVKDTVLALGQITHFYRKKFNIPVVAVTGSNGKTTTKEMVSRVLEAKFKVLKSQGSFNNHIGVPLTLLNLDDTYQAAVLEMGMNHKGEIRYLAGIAEPDIAVITNVGQAHMEFFEDLSEIARAKCELLENLGKDATAIINADSPELLRLAKTFPVKLLTYGENPQSDFRITALRVKEGKIAFAINGRNNFELEVFGRHNAHNAAAAIAAAHVLGIATEAVKKQLKSFRLNPLRMESFFLQGIQIIADCYNANPASMEAAVISFSEIKNRKRKIIVFADMLELGKFSASCHKRLGTLIAGKKINLLITVGKEAAYAAQGALESGMGKENIFTCNTNKDVLELLKSLLKPEDAVLLKGSRRMRLEEISEKLSAGYGILRKD